MGNSTSCFCFLSCFYICLSFCAYLSVGDLFVAGWQKTTIRLAVATQGFCITMTMTTQKLLVLFEISLQRLDHPMSSGAGRSVWPILLCGSSFSCICTFCGGAFVLLDVNFEPVIKLRLKTQNCVMETQGTKFSSLLISTHAKCTFDKPHKNSYFVILKK